MNWNYPVALILVIFALAFAVRLVVRTVKPPVVKEAVPLDWNSLVNRVIDQWNDLVTPVFIIAFISVVSFYAILGIVLFTLEKVDSTATSVLENLALVPVAGAIGYFFGAKTTNGKPPPEKPPELPPTPPAKQ